MYSMSTKRPRLNAESFDREEKRLHALLDESQDAFMSSPAALRDTSQGSELGSPESNIDELKGLVSSSLRQKYGMDVASRDKTSSADCSVFLGEPSSRHKRLKEGFFNRANKSPDTDQTSNHRDGLSTSTQTIEDSSNSPSEQEYSSENSSYTSMSTQNDEVAQSIRSPLFRSKQDLYRLHEETFSEDDTAETESIDTEKDEDINGNMRDPSISEVNMNDASRENWNDNDWSDVDDDEGSDLDEDEEERLVRQICLSRVESQAKDSEGEFVEDEMSGEDTEADEETECVRFNGRTYESGRTYFRTIHGGDTYMFAVLKLYRRPDGEKYAECVQVHRLAETFLSTVESGQHEHVRLSGVNRFRLDDRFGDEVDEIDGIPEMVYEVKRGKRLHLAFYPPVTNDLPRIRTSSKPTVLDLFAGAGGMHLGFHAAGFETAMAVEKNPFAVQTLSATCQPHFPW